jgi:hypothetical protein
MIARRPNNSMQRTALRAAADAERWAIAKWNDKMDLYDTLGHGYRKLRKQDLRIAARILRALGGSTSVVNVGAGAGSYEPRDRTLIAVEPSLVMIRQRARNAAPVLCGRRRPIFHSGMLTLMRHSRSLPSTTGPISRAGSRNSVAWLVRPW